MPLDTILLLDTSGSMAGRGIRELKRACNTFLDGVQETATQTGLKVCRDACIYSYPLRFLFHNISACAWCRVCWFGVCMYNVWIRLH